MTDLNNFLDMKLGDVKEPEVLPSGRYKFVITSYKTGKRNNEAQTPYVAFVLKPVEVLESEEVDDDVELKSYKNVFNEFPITDAAAPILKRFLTGTLGFDEETDFRVAFEDAIGHEVGAIVEKKYVGQNKDIPIADVKKYVPLED